MDAKISAATWRDPDLDNFTPEMLLTLHWMKTNTDRNDCGAYRFSPATFTFETKGLDASWHEKTRLALGEMVLNEGPWFLYLPFIRECLWLGPVRGKNKGLNRGWQALTKPFLGLPKPFHTPLLTEYPELREVLAEYPESQCVADVNGSHYSQNPEGVGKGLVRGGPPPDQIRSDQIRSGESEGGGALVPGEEEVLAFAKAWEDLARGLKVIPEAYALNWLAWRCSPKAGPWPKNWQKDLSWRYVSDALAGKTTARVVSPHRALAAQLDWRIENARTPEERTQARREKQQFEASLEGGQS